MSVSFSCAAGTVSVENCCPKRHANRDVFMALCKLEKAYTDVHHYFGKVYVIIEKAQMTSTL